MHERMYKLFSTKNTGILIKVQVCEHGQDSFLPVYQMMVQKGDLMEKNKWIF